MYLSNKAVNLPFSMGSVNKMFSFVDDAKNEIKRISSKPRIRSSQSISVYNACTAKKIRV